MIQGISGLAYFAETAMVADLRWANSQALGSGH
jgi:hypothetical protein